MIRTEETDHLLVFASQIYKHMGAGTPSASGQSPESKSYELQSNRVARKYPSRSSPLRKEKTPQPPALKTKLVEADAKRAKKNEKRTIDLQRLRRELEERS